MKLELTSDNVDAPILSELDIKIGQMFLYNNRFWVRTDRYVASVIGTGTNACRFGTVKEFVNEIKDYKGDSGIIKLDQDKIINVLNKNLINIKEK